MESKTYQGILFNNSRLQKKHFDSLRYTDHSWDYRHADTKDLTHCFHAYPAMMIPQIPRRLLKKYGYSAKTLFDPYCGTGTSLVEANMKGINAIGTDLNPLARLIAKAKTTLIDLQILNSYLSDFNHYLLDFSSNDYKYEASLHRFDFWFHKSTQKKLSFIKQFIDSIKHSDIKNFFLTAFSETVRESSLTKKGEFKLIRISENQRQLFRPNSFKIMISKLLRNKIGLLHYDKQKKNNAFSKLHKFNTVHFIPKGIISDKSIDIVITSPPYGDSRTTVAYGQYSRFANEWIGLKEASSVDKSLMGGIKYSSCVVFPSPYLKDTLEEIDRQDSKRRLEVEAFFIDYQKSINNVSKTLKLGGIACYVVGNRTVRGINIPTDLITKDFFESSGFKHLETIIRDIPNKRMPSKNSPSNKIGQKSTTMKNEFIVICERVK